MQESDLQRELYRIVNRMLEAYDVDVGPPPEQMGLGPPKYPFDITKPNEHDTKREFQREYEAVVQGLKSMDELITAMIAGERDPEGEVTFRRLAGVIDQKAKYGTHRTEINKSINLIRRNVADTGAYATTLMILLDLQVLFRERSNELEQQRDNFWNLPHRPPDYHARVIALRLAKLFAQKTGQRPTYGSSPDLAEPSTPYSRALKDVFSALGIAAQERGHAEWAVHQIEERDLQPIQEGLLALFTDDDDSGLTKSEREIAILTRAAKRNAS